MTIPSGLLPIRAADVHKSSVGRIVVIGGSVGLTGAALLCSQAALRAGAGLVTLATPEAAYPAIAAQSLEVIVRPMADTKAGSLSLAALSELLRLIETADVVALGPGLSQEAQTKQLVRQLIPKLAKPCVIDADGLNAIAEELPVLKRAVVPLILTPHPGEMARLAQLSVADVQRDRDRLTKEFASRYGAVVVLKGHRTLIADPDGRLEMNTTGNPGMASAGMGDVLTGVIAAFIGQGLSPFDAARLGAHVHGLAGDLAAEEQGRVGLLASDALARIPQAIRRYQQ